MALATWQGPTFGAPGAHSAIGPAMYRALQDPRDYSRLWPAKLGRKTGLSRLERPASEQLFPRPYSSSLVLRETQRFPVSTQGGKDVIPRKKGKRREKGRRGFSPRFPPSYLVLLPSYRAPYSLPLAIASLASRRNDGRNGGRRGGGRINRFNRRPGNYIVGQS
eukprot:1388648-Amorphochlora_amoeboformis.AAC.3